MRNKEFEKKLVQLDAKIKNGILKTANPSEEIFVLAGLADKSHSHCHTGRELIISDAFAEAIIILRAAYETTILALYLSQNTERIKRYLVYSALTTLRNQMELLDTLKQHSVIVADEEEEEQNFYIENQQKKIIDSGNLRELNLSNEDLKDWKKIKKYSNSAHFMKFEDLRTNIKKDESMRALFDTGYQVYNLGAQLAHANFEMVKAMLHADRSHPLYSEYSAYTQILNLTLQNAKIFHRCNYLSESTFNAIQNSCKAIALEFRKSW